MLWLTGMAMLFFAAIPMWPWSRTWGFVPAGVMLCATLVTMTWLSLIERL